jgi:hypothetical protein
VNLPLGEGIDGCGRECAEGNSEACVAFSFEKDDDALLRTFAVFDAEFPDDGEFTPEGDVERPAGASVASALANILEAHRWEVAAPKQYSYYGWEITVTAADTTVWVLLQYPGPWLLTTQERIRFLKNGDSRYRQVLEAINQGLGGDSRFRNVRWLQKKSMSKEGLERSAHSAPKQTAFVLRVRTHQQ